MSGCSKCGGKYGTSFPCTCDPKDDEIEELQSEIALLNAKIKELERENKKLHSDASFVESLNKTLMERRDSLFPDMVREAREQGAREMYGVIFESAKEFLLGKIKFFSIPAEETAMTKLLGIWNQKEAKSK